MKSNNTNIKCISLDLDGTLIEFDSFARSHVTEQNVNAIKEFCSKEGNQIVLATGRSIPLTIPILEDLYSKGISQENIPYVICLNGAVILDTKDLDTPVCNQHFKEDVCKRIRDFLKKNKVSFFMINSQREITHSINLFSILIYQLTLRKRYRKRYLRPDFPLHNIQKILICTYTPRAKKWRKILTEEFGQDCYVSQGFPFHLEISDKSINKFYGLQKVAQMMGLEMDEIAAMGNEQNDIQCLENVGFGVGINLHDRIIYDKNKLGLSIVNKAGTGVSEAIYEMKKRGLW